MRYLFLFFTSITCLGQAGFGHYSDEPYFAGRPIVNNVNSNCNNFDFSSITSAVIYAQFFAYAPTNFGTTPNPSQLVWKSMTTNWGNSGTVMLESGTTAVETNHNGPNGFWSVDFTSSTGLGIEASHAFGGGYVAEVGSNQPNTIFMVCTDVGKPGNGATLYDEPLPSGDRNLTRLVTDGLGTFYAAPTFVGAYIDANNGNWFIYSWLWNSNTSYFRTNGILAKAGDPGTMGLKDGVLIGDDRTHVTAYLGKVWSFLIFAGIMNTNELILVERVLNCQANLGYTIPSP